jgi:hypothetical protein
MFNTGVGARAEAAQHSSSGSYQNDAAIILLHRNSDEET